MLDVNMPGLNGFQTMRALEQAGSRAPVVFLSLVDSEDLVTEAFRSGGRGYVVKLHVVRDLACALDHVLHGRLFAPSLTSLFQLADGTGPVHAMQIYADRSAFIASLAAFFDVALRRGDATCILATEDLREGLRAQLLTRGWNVGGPSGHRRCLVVDTTQAMNRIMRDGLPSADLLAEVLAELDHYRRTIAEDSSSRLTYFGNSVVSLIANGDIEAAIALENQWNVLTHDRPIFTLCGYETSCFDHGPAELLSRACAEHWAVSHSADL